MCRCVKYWHPNDNAKHLSMSLLITLKWWDDQNRNVGLIWCWLLIATWSFQIVSWFYFCMEETWDYVSVNWRWDKFQLWANCFTGRSPVFNACLRMSKTPSDAHCYVQRLNHSAMTCPPKKEWHQLTGIESIVIRNEFPLDGLHLALEETWEHVSVHWQQGKFKLCKIVKQKCSEILTRKYLVN